ncbi:hypothetical protein [Rhizobium rhizogenes]|uniref:hypothetical protein n=1 Tax=Rhizobium rhizogenes TaxID=359 RepID=UPI001572057E|nr:hypothetical protein [Rhizobium rhizogenes]NTI27648.1 hypothetical protein [Rhizobium rhizogenes]
MTPDFSPDMLKSFLRLRVAAMVLIDFPSVGKSGERAARTALRQRSGLTRDEFEMAWMGRLRDGKARAKIWAALWVDPATFGLLLTDDGGQEVRDAT